MQAALHYCQYGMSLLRRSLVWLCCAQAGRPCRSPCLFACRLLLGIFFAFCRGALQACALTRSWHGRGTRRRVPRLKYNSIPQHLFSAPPRTEPGARIVRSRGLFFDRLPVVDAHRWAPLARRALFSRQTFQAQASCAAHAEISVQLFGAGFGWAGNYNEASALLTEQALVPINSQQSAC